VTISPLAVFWRLADDQAKRRFFQRGTLPMKQKSTLQTFPGFLQELISQELQESSWKNAKLAVPGKGTKYWW
jgi:hypothetical protein